MQPSFPRRFWRRRRGGTGITIRMRVVADMFRRPRLPTSGETRQYPGQILDPLRDQVDHGPVALDPAGDAQQPSGDHRPAAVIGQRPRHRRVRRMGGQDSLKRPRMAHYLEQGERMSTASLKLMHPSWGKGEGIPGGLPPHHLACGPHESHGEVQRVMELDIWAAFPYAGFRRNRSG